MPKFHLISSDSFEVETSAESLNDEILGVKDYRVEGEWYGGSELKGPFRRTQEDRILAFQLEVQEEVIFRALSEELKQTLLQRVFRKLNAEVNEKFSDLWQGSTGIVSIFDPTTDQYLVANLGDSQLLAVTLAKDDLKSSIRINKLHHPSEPDELKRIEKDGGKVIGNRLEGSKRVYENGAWKTKRGKIAVSRAFGDTAYIDAGLIQEPELYTNACLVDKEDELFFVQACDGLTEIELNEQAIGKFILEHREDTLGKIAQNLGETAIKKGSKDNVSVQIFKYSRLLEGIYVLCVFDGHGGQLVVQYLKDNFPDTFKLILQSDLSKEEDASIEPPGTPVIDEDDLPSTPILATEDQLLISLDQTLNSEKAKSQTEISQNTMFQLVRASSVLIERSEISGAHLECASDSTQTKLSVSDELPKQKLKL